MESEQLKSSGAFPDRVQLSLDPGSNQMGVAIFDTEGKFLRSTTLRGSAKAVAARRLNAIGVQFEAFMQEFFSETIIVNTVMELLPPSQITPSLPISPGAIVSRWNNCSRLLPKSAIPVNVWKSVAKQLGCTMSDPKGVKIFKQIPWSYPQPKTHDEADAIMIFLAHSWEVKGLVWLAPDLRVRRMKR